MKTRNKILISLFLLVLLFLASFCGAILYFYFHPSAVKPFIEKTVSRSTGASFTIKTLSYSLKPMRVRAEGITLEAPGDEDGPLLEIPGMEANMVLSGPFGHKTLNFTSLRIDGFSFHFSEKAPLPGMRKGEEPPSFLSRILKGATALFLFRDIALEGAELLNGHVAGRFGDSTLQVKGIHAEMDAEHRIAISGNLQIAWPSQNVLLAAPHVHLATNGEISLVDPEIVATLTVTNVTYDSPQMIAQGLQGKAEIIYSHKKKTLLFRPAGAEVEQVSLKRGAQEQWPSMRLRVKGKGIFDIHERRLEASSLDLSLNDTLQVMGKLEMGFGDGTDFKFQVLDNHFLAQEILALLPDRLRKRWPRLALSGPVQLRGSISGLREKGEWGLHFDLRTSLKNNRITCRVGHIQLDSHISGSILASGKFPDVDMSLKLLGDETMISGVGIQPEPFKVGLDLSGKHPLYILKDLSVQIPRARLALGKKDFFVDYLHMQAEKGEMDIRERTLFIPELRFDSSLVKNLLIALELDRETLNLQFQGKDAHLLESAMALELIPSEWQIGGKDSFQLNALLNDNGDWTFTSELGLQDLRFQNQDGSTVGENISVHTKVDAKIDRNHSHIDAKANLKVEEGELLYDRFYLDLNSNALLSFMEGGYDLPQKFLKLSSLRFQLKNIIKLAMNGSVHFRARKPRVRLSFNVPKTPLKPLFHHFVQEPFKTMRPSLALLKLGGTIAGDLNFAGTTSDWRAKGRCQWHRGEFSSADGTFTFEGVDLDLPVWQQASTTGEDLELKEEKLEGKLSIKSFLLPPLPLQSLHFPLEASPNRLSVTSSTLLKVPGGKIQLGPVMCENIYRSHRSIETSLSLDAVKLDPLLTDIWNQPLTGTIEGRLDPVYFEGHALSTKGNLTTRLFGGEVQISDLAASGLFTPTPLIKLDAKWQDLHLGDLTRETPFGKIEGRLMGFVDDLEIAYGQPQRFNLLLETVKKKGVSQKMSQKAVDSIAQIGGGQSPFTGVAGMMTSFFEEFPYEKIGIRASLENDLFRINGTIREGGTEYYVKGSGVPRVNIINVNPDNQIRFKDMVKRIRRIASSKRGPVIN